MKHVEEVIQNYLAGELGPVRAAAVEKHLAECPRCRREVEQARKLWNLIDAAEVVSVEEGSIWPAVRERTLVRKSARHQWFFGSGPWTRRGLAAGAVAAGLVVGLLAPAGSVDKERIAVAQENSSWPVELFLLMDSSWLGTGETPGLDDVLLGVDLAEEGNGS